MYQSSKKTEVKRLKADEFRLIETLRLYDMATVSTALGEAIASLPEGQSRQVLEAMQNSYQDTTGVKLVSYVDSGAMSGELYDTIKDALQNGKPIMVTGQAGAGKTVLLKSFIDHLNREGRSNFSLFEVKTDIRLMKAQDAALEIAVHSPYSCTVSDFVKDSLNNMNYTVVDDAHMLETIFSLGMAAMYSKSLLVAAQVPDSVSISDFYKELGTSANMYNNIASVDFLRLHLESNGENLTVRVIQ